MRFSAPLYLFDHKDSSLKVVPLGTDHDFIAGRVAHGGAPVELSAVQPLPLVAHLPSARSVSG